MQSTGHSRTQDLSLTSTQASVMTYGIVLLLHLERLSLAEGAVPLAQPTGAGRTDHDRPPESHQTWGRRPDRGTHRRRYSPDEILTLPEEPTVDRHRVR